MIESYGVIYALYCTCHNDGFRYIGQTIQDRHTRLRGHKKAARGGKNFPVAAWIREHNFNVEAITLEDCSDERTLHAREVYWIKHLRDIGLDLLNVCEGGKTSTRGVTYKREQKRFCKRGHEFTEENTMWIPNGERVQRRCKTCKRYIEREWEKAHPNRKKIENGKRVRD